MSTRRELLQGLGASALGMTPGAPAGHAAYLARTSERQTPAAPFDLASVRLLPGPFKTAQQFDAHYLLTLVPDRLLHNFRVNAGLEPKAPIYGGWESQEPWVDIRIAPVDCTLACARAERPLD